MNIQKKSNIFYSNQAFRKNINPSEKAGRFKSQSKLEKYIFTYIEKILDLKKKEKFLDIGCGCGPLTDLIIKFCIKKKIKVFLCDIPEVINVLKKKYSNYKYVYFFEGEFQKLNLKKSFDKILCYSVIQCVNNPKLFYKNIFKLSKPKSKILIGDIPNINKKFRFLSSEFGLKFESKRLKKKVVIKNFSDFLAKTKQNKLVDDKFINFIFNHSRKNLRNCFVIKQPKKLPFSYTREDVLIEGF